MKNVRQSSPTRPYSEAKKAYKNDQLSLPGNFISVTTAHATQVNHTLEAPVGSTFPAHARVDWLENTEPGVGPLPLVQGRCWSQSCLVPILVLQLPAVVSSVRSSLLSGQGHFCMCPVHRCTDLPCASPHPTLPRQEAACTVLGVLARGQGLA